MRRTTLPLLLTTAVLSAAAGGLPTAEAHDSHRHHRDFEAALSPVNHHGEGKVDLRQLNHELRVMLKAKGLDDGIHLAHIHGIREAQNMCPDAGFDADHNGLVDIAEGLPAYGPVQITLSNGLNDTGTALKYRRTFGALDSGEALAALGDLDQYAIVVHGVDLDGDGVANNPNAGGDAANDADDNEISMPALCGPIVTD